MFHVVWTRRRPFSLLVGWVGFDSWPQTEQHFGILAAFRATCAKRVMLASTFQTCMEICGLSRQMKIEQTTAHPRT